MPETRFNIPRFVRFARNSAALAGLVLIIGGIAWHDIAAAFVVGGFGLVCIAITGMILARRN